MSRVAHSYFSTLFYKCSRYRPGVAQKFSRGIAVLFLDHGSRGVSGQQHALAALYPRERPGIHFTGGWVGPRAGLDWGGKSRPHRDSIPDRAARSSVATPTELPGHTLFCKGHDFRKKNITEHKICVLMFCTTYV